MTIHLSFLLWLPAAGGLIGAILGRRGAGWATLAGSAAALGYAIVAVADFAPGDGLQYVTDSQWIEQLGTRWKLGVDGLNLFLVLLTTVAFTASILWATLKGDGAHPPERPAAFFFWLGLAHSAVLGALLAQDLLVFTIFFDLMLVPFLFLTGMFGGEDRIRSVTRLFIYTLVGSLLMLAAAIAFAVLAAGAEPVSFVFSDLAERGRISEGSQNWIFLFFAAAFLIKMPAFPLHGWMPAGYLNMPLPVLAVFSGVLSKVAAYGFLKISLPFFPDASEHFQTLLLLIALASILYGSAMAFTTTNVRLVLGYSSIAQLGFIVLGIFSLRSEGAQGALLQSVNHGLVVVPAFFVVALLAARAQSEDLREMGGGAFRAPVLAALFLIIALATLAMPGSSNFAGEFLILLGVFQAKQVIAIIAFTGVVLASVYMLRMFIRTMHNRTGATMDPREITVRDGLVLVPLVLAVLALSVYPQVALDKSEPAVKSALGEAGGQAVAQEPDGETAP
ncbi:MAG TPA: NADH-quinone oxidoreductase subunit M [Solirubrobacteraceae bacterium]|nr:NADH-quinone oxidoreductase subunit M [Solirubrobacteraceae bacterium]